MILARHILKLKHPKISESSTFQKVLHLKQTPQDGGVGAIKEGFFGIRVII